MKFFKRKKAAEQPPADPQGTPADAGEESSAPADQSQGTSPAPAVQPAAAEPAVETESAPEPSKAPEIPTDAATGSVFSRLRRGLGRTSDNLVAGLGTLFLGRKEIDADLLEELESQLLLADVGVDATVEIIERLTQRVSRRELTSPEGLRSALQEELLALLRPCEQTLEPTGHSPFVILMVGVNGVGKTTTIGKLARRYQAEGRSVMLPTPPVVCTTRTT